MNWNKLNNELNTETNTESNTRYWIKYAPKHQQQRFLFGYFPFTGQHIIMT